MKIKRRGRGLALFLVNCSLLIVLAGCDWDSITDDLNVFDYSLRGTWVSDNKNVYSGRLEITYNTISITGYDASQTPQGSDDARRPFKGFMKDVALGGYSRNGKFVIWNAGIWQDGIPYEYTVVGPYPQKRYLRFTFGGRVEILRKQYQ